MNENKSWSSIGEEIRDAVQRALQDGDFSGLGDAAANTVSDTLKNVSVMVERSVSHLVESLVRNQNVASSSLVGSKYPFHRDLLV